MKTGLKVLLIYAFVTVFALVAYAVTQTDVTMTWVVPSNVSHSVAYGGSCSSSAFYFVESNCAFDSDVDGNGSKCVPYDASSGGSACQDGSSLQAIVVTNNGNIDVNIDGNFTAGFSGSDLNLVLKIWKGNDTHCGTSGLGGWEDPCSVTGATSPVTTTTCRNYNQFNETAAGRLITALETSDTNGLCFSGDFNGTVTQGEHAVTFRLTSVS